jgi:tetratricopeptide (TPR) repeat protein
MDRHLFLRRGAIGLLFTAAAVAAPALAQHAAAPPPGEPAPENLKVLPKGTSRAEVVALMGQFTRALGVRCSFCHVTEQENPTAKNRFALDDKPAKNKARAMMEMTRDINEKYLAGLDKRETPAINVQCVTCHRGVTEPRQLSDVLANAYEKGGIDSTMSRYHRLRDRYYGSASYNFNEVSLADAANQLARNGHHDDALKLLALNVEMNPNSPFPKRNHADALIEQAYMEHGADAGAAAYRDVKGKYGEAVVNEELLNQVAYDLLEQGKSDLALAAFKLNVAEHPQSGNAYDSLGEGYARVGDRKQAIAAYKKSFELDPKNLNAKQRIEELKKKK